MAQTKVNQDILRVGAKTAIACVMASHAIKRPVMLWSAPGMGKSSLVRKAADDMHIGFIDLRLVQVDSLDLRGMPFKDEKDGMTVMSFAQSGFLPRTGQGILFLDELPQAPIMVQNAASELLLDRRIGEYNLPDGWSIVAAGNRRTDRAGTNEIPSHLKNRLLHVELEVEATQWIEWAKTAGIHPDVVGYISTTPKMLHAFDPDLLAFPTNRSWEFVSDIMHGNYPEEVWKPLVAGAVGKGAMIEFDSYRDRGKGLPSYEDIIADPEHAPIPKSESDAYALITLVSDRATPADIDKAIIYLKRNKRDWTRAGLSRMVTHDKGFMKIPSFAAYAKEFGEA